MSFRGPERPAGPPDPSPVSARPAGPTRRAAVLSGATALAALLFARRTLAGPADQGIGGTGFSLRPADEDSDRGIGGTGVIGTIRKFGSIVVNDLRIAYPPDVTVRIDDRAATAADLKLGQVVRVVAGSTRSGGLATHVIDVTSEVVGVVERVAPKSLTVLGQTVSTASLSDAKRWRVGDHVAVSGLRRNDGTIVASLVEPSDRALSKVVGPLVTAADGSTRIGGLKLSGVDGTLIGQRAIVEGRAAGTGLVVTRSLGETTLISSDVRTLSVEAFVERRGETLHLGSGLKVAGSTADLPAGRPVRAVLSTVVAQDGNLSVSTLRANGQRYPATDRPTVTPDRSGGSRPTDVGRTPGGDQRPANGLLRDRGGSGVPLEGQRPPGGALFGPPGGGPGPGGITPGGMGPGGMGPGGFGPRGGFGGGGRR